MPIFFISRKLYFWSVDETCVSEICKYTNLIETNDFFTSAISTLPVIFIILTKTFCLLQYSFLFKTQAISSTTFLTSFFTKIGTIYCSKGRLNLMRTFLFHLPAVWNCAMYNQISRKPSRNADCYSKSRKHNVRASSIYVISLWEFLQIFRIWPRCLLHIWNQLS